MNYLTIILATLSMLLAGCATTIRSDVTAFHEWPAQLQDKSYVFVAPPAREDTLEYRSYQNLVRDELARLGFAEASRAGTAKLIVVMHFSTTVRPLRVLEAIDPIWTGPSYWPGRHGYYRNPWAYQPFYGYGQMSPFYDPYLAGPVNLRETIRHNYERELRVAIDSSSGKKLFDVTAHNTSATAATAAVMPAMIASAFAGFPGQSGVPHRVDVTLK